MSYSTELAGIIRNFLDDDDWHYEFEEEHGIFHFGYRIPGKIRKVEAIIDVKDDAFITYVICPMFADTDDEYQMTQMQKFLTMSNYGLKNGNWEFDLRDGEIRFKCFVNCDGVEPSHAVINDTLGCPAAMYNRYSNGILQILLNGKSADEAIAECESDLQRRRPVPEPEDTGGTEYTDDEDDILPDLDSLMELMDNIGGDSEVEEQAAQLLAQLRSLRSETD